MAGLCYTVRRVDVQRTLPLRKAVLRPFLAADEDYLPPDATLPAAVAHAALTPADEVIAAAVLTPEAPPFEVGGRRSWRLRGMAARPDVRGQGVGSAVVAALIGHVAGCGGGILWCNARIAAVSLYERAGFERWGAEWEEPLIGPHVVMWRAIAPASRK